MPDNSSRHRAHPTRTDAERLIAWLPILYAPDFQVELPEEERSNPEGWLPEYTAEVEAFFDELALDVWMDYGYSMTVAGEMLTPERVAVATLPEVRSMLTLCLRIERFGGGMWGAAITDGVIRLLLERVRTLLAEGAFGSESA